jgi:predicted short-subunit dehydrogenase-like oxidoreductase (DUF2520 family)
MKVVIIGAGNVATVLGRKMLDAGHTIIQVVARNAENADALSVRLHTAAAYHLSAVDPYADLYVIAVSDASIAEVASHLQVNDKIVVHTAAAVSKEVLASCSKNYGVLYPLQSLKKELERLPPVPVIVDGNNLATVNLLKEFSLGWAQSVSVANDEKRLKLHLAAVIANNFTNHLLAVCEQYCKTEQLDFNVLHPLVQETIARIGESSAAAVQTGPAIRNDNGTLEKHRQLLAAQPDLLKIYRFMTESIKDFCRTNTP